MLRSYLFSRKTTILAFLCLALQTGVVEAAPIVAAPSSTSGEPTVALDRSLGKADVAFSLSEPGKVVVKALNAQNQPMAVLLEEKLEAGSHEFSFFLREFSTESGVITLSFTSGSQVILKVMP